MGEQGYNAENTSGTPLLDWAEQSNTGPQKSTTSFFQQEADTILYDAGFSCASCGSNTLKLSCSNCGARMNQYGQAIPFPTIKPQATEPTVKKQVRKTKKVVSEHIKNLTIGEDTINFSEAKTVKGDQLSIVLEVRGMRYQVLFSPMVQHKKIDAIKTKNLKGKWQKTFLGSGNSMFFIISNAVREISRDPSAYGLSHLKAFQSN